MGQGIRVRVGDTFEIPLEGAAGTGFRWEFVPPSATTDLVELVEESREATSTVPGGRTVHHFRFHALAPGKLELTFRHRRAWEPPDSGSAQTIEVQIDPQA